MNDALKRLMDTQITISEAKWSRFSVSSRTWMDNLGTELHARFAHWPIVYYHGPIWEGFGAEHVRRKSPLFTKI